MVYRLFVNFCPVLSHTQQLDSLADLGVAQKTSQATHPHGAESILRLPIIISGNSTYI